MMRQPSTMMALTRWHRAYMRGEAPPMHDGWPEAGWYKMRRVKGGPWVPVEIWCEQHTDPETGELTEPEQLRADAFGEYLDPASIWTWLTPISRAEFRELTEFRLKNQHRLNCTTPINLGASPILPGRDR